MKATLQALQTLPEENYLVLRFLTAFLVQVGLGAGLSAPLEWGWGAAAPASLLRNVLLSLLPVPFLSHPH